MQKKLIALAIAGLASSGAFAQTNVTIYGVADVYVGSFQSDTRSAVTGDYKWNGLADGGLSGSRLGFKVLEDLGGGLKAGAVLEYGTLSVNGGAAAGAAGASGLATSRQSYVHLTSDSMGSLQLGRIYSPGHLSAIATDNEGASIFGPVSRITGSLGLSMDGSVGGTTAQGRVNNSIAWVSPNWKGFSGQVQYAFGENGEATVGDNVTKDGSFWGVGINYANGPIGATFAYHDWTDIGGKSQAVGAVGSDMQEWIIGGSYDFGMVKLIGSYQNFDQDNASTVGAGTFARAKNEGDIWSLGATIPVGKAGSVRLSYASLDRNVRTGVTGVKSSADADGWGISYQHAMSKRTTAYVGYVDMSNDKGGTVKASGNVTAPSAGQDSSGFAAGLRHTF